MLNVMDMNEVSPASATMKKEAAGGGDSATSEAPAARTVWTPVPQQHRAVRSPVRPATS